MIIRRPIIFLAFFAALLLLFENSYAQTPDAASAFRSLQSASSAATQPTKPWLDDFAGFVRDHPGRWIVGRSHDPCLSEAEAEQTARTDGINKIEALLSPQLRNRDVATSLSADIAAGDFQADSLIERFDRPYGTVWTESVLLDASPQKLDSLLSGYQRAWRDRQHRIAMTRISAALLVAAAWLMYIFLNAATKGYFTTRLRLGAAAVTAVAIVLSL